MSVPAHKISCIILAGGEGKRVGGVDKGLLKYKNKPLVEHVIDSVKPQIDELIISANRNLEIYKKYTDKIICDESEQYLGPLAGINSALTHCAFEWILITPCDTPFLPNNLVEKLFCYHSETNLYIAQSNDKLQPVMLIHKSLHESIAFALSHNQLRLMRWAQSHHPRVINFSDNTSFKNFNNTDDFT